MAKHYYTMEIVTDTLLDPEDLDDLADIIVQGTSNEIGVIRANVEYVDSE